MRILERYILRNFIFSFLFCIILLMVLGIIGDVLGFMDEIFKNNIPVSSILSFYLYLAPFAFVNMVPFACLLSAAFVFNSLSKYHEITAVIASGLSLWKLLRPVVVIVFMVCVATFIINDKYVPSTMRKANVIRKEELESSGGRCKNKQIQNLAVYGKGDQIIFSKDYDPVDKILHNVIIHKQDKSHVIYEKITAGIVKYVDDKVRWKGEDVIIFTADEEGKFSRDPSVFKIKKINIEESPKDFFQNHWDPKFMTYKQLKAYLELFRGSSKETVRRLSVDLQYKLALPFAALIMILIGVPFSIETGRANALVGMVRGMTIGMLYIPVMAISLALGKGGVLPPIVAAWLANVLFAALGLYYIHKKS